MKTRAMFGASCIGLTVVLAACTSSSGNAPSAGGRSAGRHGMVISVGTFDFPESVLLAEIYGQALAARGYPVRILANLGPRELVDPALMKGLLRLVPEYAGSALEFATLGRLSATADAAAANRTLAESLAGRGLLAAAVVASGIEIGIVYLAGGERPRALAAGADPWSWLTGASLAGPALGAAAVACTVATAPWLTRPWRRTASITLWLAAAARLFTGTASPMLVVLADDRALQPAENITPVVGREVVARYGTRMLTLINAVSARLTTGSLRSLDAQVVLDGRRPRSVAGAWLRAQGLMQTGGVVH